MDSDLTTGREAGTVFTGCVDAVEDEDLTWTVLVVGWSCGKRERTEVDSCSRMILLGLDCFAALPPPVDGRVFDEFPDDMVMAGAVVECMVDAILEGGWIRVLSFATGKMKQLPWLG